MVQMAAEVLQWGPLSIMACCFLGTVLLRTRTRRLYYNGELQGLAKANLWELALALLQSLPTKKVRPDKAGRAMWI